MEPTLRAGQGLVTWRDGRARVGQIRCVEHPRRPGFWLVKRVAEVHGDHTMDVVSDNDAVATQDSRVFGPVPVAASYRVVFAVPLRWM